MDRLLSAAQMRAVEGAAIESGAVDARTLMERAGRGAVAAMFEHWPDLAQVPRRAVVLCGPGNNGGDGFVVARLLHEWGWQVAVFLCGDPDALPPDARHNCARWGALGPLRRAAEIDRADQLGALGADLFVDALFGTGLSRPVDVSMPGLAAFFEYGARWRDGGGPPTVALDLPSGVCSDSGRVLGAAMDAALTVGFHRAKPGHYLLPAEGGGAARCGALRIVDIGLPAGMGAAPGPVTALIGPPGRALDKQALGGHKYSHGHALVLAGGAGRTGAARLAARGALRIGAGLVSLAAPGGAMMECASHLTAIMLRRCDDAQALAGLLEDARFSALCLGPGLGTGPREAALVRAALAARRPTVLDADALSLLATDASLFAALHADCLLTPHGGEFARLFPDLAADLAAPDPRGPACSKLDVVRAAAARAGCAVLLKGADTVIAAPDGRAWVHAALYDRAAPWLATAGAGDVLAGIAAGLMARGIDAPQAAGMAAWLHVEAARAFGPGLIAEDLPECLPRVLRALGL
ncbi:MAG: NAD(P)H-hydrate dehydratase [Rhodobacteraceae bacterium]|nr:NAD(P)H-hydrate dehydratase [Paracoccaceae bacterium]